MVRFIVVATALLTAPFRAVATLIEIALGAIVLAAFAAFFGWYWGAIPDEAVVAASHRLFSRIEILAIKVAASEDSSGMRAVPAQAPRPARPPAFPPNAATPP